MASIGYTGIVRRGYALRPPASNEVKLEDITEPCPTCGLPAVRQKYDSIRPDGTYRVTQLRCPNAQVRRDTKRGSKDVRDLSKVTCPIHETEIKIGESTMPIQKICTVMPRPEDQAEYKRLKAVLGLENKDFIKLAGLSNGPTYDWFAGRAISPDTEIRILHAIKELQKREGVPVVKASNGRQIDEAGNPADPVSEPVPTVDTGLAPTDHEDLKCGQTQPKWIAALRKLADTVDPMTTAVQNLELRTAVLEGRAAEVAETSANLREDLNAWTGLTDTTTRAYCARMEQLERVQHNLEVAQSCCVATTDRLHREWAELGGPRIESLDGIREELEELQEGGQRSRLSVLRINERLNRLEVNREAFLPPVALADQVQLVIRILTPMSDDFVNSILSVVDSRKMLIKADRLLAQAVSK